MATEKISVDDLLAGQLKGTFLATVEAVDGRPDQVKITPWTASGGCLCHLAMNVSKASLAGVTPTGETHVCCGRTFKVAELHFKKDETISLEDVFGQLNMSASKAVDSGHGGASPMYAPGQGPKGDPPPWGWGPPPWAPFPLPHLPHPWMRYASHADYAEPVSCSNSYGSCIRACGKNFYCLSGCMEQYLKCERIPRPFPI